MSLLTHDPVDTDDALPLLDRRGRRPALAAVWTAVASLGALYLVPFMFHQDAGGDIGAQCGTFVFRPHDFLRRQACSTSSDYRAGILLALVLAVAAVTALVVVRRRHPHALGRAATRFVVGSLGVATLLGLAGLVDGTTPSPIRYGPVGGIQVCAVNCGPDHATLGQPHITSDRWLQGVGIMALAGLAVVVSWGLITTHLKQVVASVGAGLALFALFAGPLVFGSGSGYGSDGVYYRCGSFAVRPKDFQTRLACSQTHDYAWAGTCALILSAVAVVVLLTSRPSARQFATRLVGMTALTTVALVVAGSVDGHSPAGSTRHIASAFALQRIGFALLAVTALLLVTSSDVRRRLREEFG